MKIKKLGALTLVELKKLYRAPMNLAVMVLMPIGLALIFFFALSGVYNDYYPVRAHISRPGHWSNYVYSDDAQAIANRMNGSLYLSANSLCDSTSSTLTPTTFAPMALKA